MPSAQEHATIRGLPGDPNRGGSHRLEIEDLVGVPYLEGGRTLKGLDCWGVAMEVYRRLGVDLPDLFPDGRSAQWVDVEWLDRTFRRFTRLASPRFGCWLAFEGVDGYAVHAGIVIAEHPVQFIHAVRRAGVCVTRLERPPWQERLIGIYGYRSD